MNVAAISSNVKRSGFPERLLTKIHCIRKTSRLWRRKPKRSMASHFSQESDQHYFLRSNKNIHLLEIKRKVSSRLEAGILAEYL